MAKKQKKAAKKKEAAPSTPGTPAPAEGRRVGFAKKSGKRTMVGPLDVEADFHDPVKAPPAQQELLTPPEPEPVPAVQGDRMMVQYVKPTFRKSKAGNRIVSLELSLPVTEEHQDLLPRSVREGWKFIGKNGNKRLDIVDVPHQIARFWLTHDDKEEMLTLPIAQVSHVSLQVVESRGAGKKTKAIRFSFRLSVPLSAEVAKFSEWRFGDTMWLYMAESQEEMFPEEGEE